MLETRGEQRVLEHRFTCYFVEREGARALGFRVMRYLFLHGVEPRCQVQQIPIAASRLHVMAAVFEAEACRLGTTLGLRLAAAAAPRARARSHLLCLPSRADTHFLLLRLSPRVGDHSIEGVKQGLIVFTV